MKTLDSLRGLVLVAAACETLLLGDVGSAQAHGELDVRIERVTAKIADAADDPEPLLQRAQLYRLSGQFREAHADLDRASRIAPGLREVEYRRGTLLLDEGDPNAARLVLDRLLAAEPDHVGGHIARARALHSLGRSGEAAAAYTEAIQRARVPTPDPYLERARTLADAGPVQIAKALVGLDQGIDALGPLPALTRAAVELELRAGRSEAALARIERETTRSRQPVWWLERKAEVLAAEGRQAEAHRAYGEALRLLHAQPATRRRAPAWRDLERRLTAALSRLRPGHPEVNPDLETEDRDAL